ncbi:MAG: hypothetical protein KIT45_11670 [Fimbriimonadia bacterium]|nr:hypothetical protein [Fimbriimonadia bacterium]
MKPLVLTKTRRFDIDDYRTDIDDIVMEFDRYLDEYPVKTAKSMHSLMGPVPMILDGARVRKESAPTLIGRAVRMHEMNPRAKGYLSPQALKALENATNKLLALCDKVPVTAVTKVTERIRYSIYYRRRKKGVQWLEETRLAFVAYLKKKYSDDDSFATAWGKNALVLEKAPFPSKNNMLYQQGNNNIKEDINAFWSMPEAERLVQEEEDNE